MHSDWSLGGIMIGFRHQRHKIIHPIPVLHMYEYRYNTCVGNTQVIHMLIHLTDQTCITGVT